MPRSSQRSNQKKQPQAQLVVPADDQPKPVFDLVVGSFVGTLPGAEGYDPEKDRMTIGFNYGNRTVPSWLPFGTKIEEITPYDFLTNPQTGLRQGQTLKPHGSAFENLDRGITEWTDLPPLFVWSTGDWLSDVLWHPQFDLDDLPSFIKKKVDDELLDWPKSGVPLSLFHYWVTSGEGTTGNNLYRVFELPAEEAKGMSPRHPRHWPESLKKKSWSNYGTGTGLGSRPSTSTPTTPKAPAIPAGVRYRCVGCGHWFGQSDLPGHIQVCGKGEDSDWAMMCHSDCGCQNLDEASTPKPGFPRPKPEVVTSNDPPEEVATP